MSLSLRFPPSCSWVMAEKEWMDSNLHARTHTHTCVHVHRRTQTYAHAHTRTHTYTVVTTGPSHRHPCGTSLWTDPYSCTELLCEETTSLKRFRLDSLELVPSCTRRRHCNHRIPSTIRDISQQIAVILLMYNPQGMGDAPSVLLEEVLVLTDGEKTSRSWGAGSILLSSCV